jgi:hypothetical protein
MYIKPLKFKKMHLYILEYINQMSQECHNYNLLKVPQACQPSFSFHAPLGASDTSTAHQPHPAMHMVHFGDMPLLSLVLRHIITTLVACW